MGVYIDREEAIKCLDGSVLITKQSEAEAVKEYFEMVIKRLESVPTVDLVRCGECKYQVKHWHEDNRMKSKGFYYYHCDRNEDPFVAHTVNGEPTDFCSYGERRADEHTDKRD